MSTTTPPTRGSFAAMYQVSRDMSHDVAPRQLKLAQLEPNPDQPRQSLQQSTVEELAASIRVHGLLQPLLVRPHPSGAPGKFQIVAGERRFHACRLAGLDAVAVVIRTLDDQNARQIALIENLQREDITPLEEAHVLKQILDETGLSHRDVGERLGKTKAYVEQRVRLLRYPVEVREALAAAPDHFTPGHAKAVVQVTDASQRQALVAEIATQGMTVRDVEKRVHGLLAKAQSPTTVEAQAVTATPIVLAELAVFALIQRAQAAGEATLDRESLRRALRADMSSL